ncbi:MAG: ROK family protein [Clostridia bacterium]|nr:ROK family protein [Clostridia bacterium]
MESRYALAFDIGGSKLVAGIVDGGGKVIATRHCALRKVTERFVIDEVLRLGRDLLKTFQGAVDCIGVSIPGLADFEKGIWIESCFSGIRGVPIADILQDAFHMKVSIDNDVNLCAVAEARYGACKGCGDFIWLTVSNGCGGALFVNGSICRGSSASAGELGHIVVEERGGYLCGCGNKGCLEAQAAGPALLRRYHRDGGKIAVASAKEVAEWARKGDPVARKAFHDEGRYLGKAIAAAVNVVNPAMVIIGGGVAQSYELFEEALNETVRRLIYRKANAMLVIRKTQAGYHAPLIGAGAMALARHV